MQTSYVFRFSAITVAVLALGGCSGGNSSDSSSTTTPPSTGVAVSGTVSAPNGSIAFNGPTLSERMFAWFAGDSAQASMSGTLPVGAGVTVSLIEIDATGTQVGATLATTTSITGGAYTLTAPADFTPAPKYIVRAAGSTGNIDAMVTDTTVDVDPSTDTTKQLVLASAQAASASLASLTATDVSEVQSQIDGLVHETDTTSTTTAATLIAAIKGECSNNEEMSNIISSIAQNGVISGKVTDSTGAALAKIKVIARDYNNWVTRAQTRTDASGNYTLHVPPSTTQGYIVGAFNYTTTSLGASEFYDGSTGAAAPLNATRVTVASGTPSTVNFQLEDGARITGTVTTDTGTALPGIRVQLRDVDTGFPTGATRSRADGSYVINVRAGSTTRYTVLATNMTLQPYGGSSYNGPAGGGDMTGGGAYINDGGAIINPSSGQTITANLKLAAGYKVAGKVTVGPAITDTPVAGIAVRMHSDALDSTNGGFVDAVRTNLQGKYRMWLKPGLYKARSRGQVRSIDLSTSDDLAGFFATVGSTTLTVTSDGTTPVSQVKVQVFDSSTTPATYLNFEPSNGDGTVTVYSSAPTTAKFVFLVDGGQTGVGTAVYDGTTTPTALRLGAVTAIDMNTTTSLGTITLPAGYALSGSLAGGSGGMRVLQIRNGATASTVGAGNFLLNARSQVDGTYSVNLQPGSYFVRLCDPDPSASTTGYCSASAATFNYSAFTMSSGNMPNTNF